MRGAQPFPNLPANTSSFTFPKRRDSYRVVSFRATIVPGQSAQALLALVDGDGNTIAHWATFLLGVLTVHTVTWAAGENTDSSNNFALPTGSVVNVQISDDLWVLPQWTLQLSINPNAVGDTISNMMLQTEWYAPKKESDNTPPQPQSSSS